MKNLTNYLLIALFAVTLTACGNTAEDKDMVKTDANTETSTDAPEISPEEEAALQAGVQMAITDIMQRAAEAPCTPINMWFKPDPSKDEKAEVYLINAGCEAIAPTVQAMVEEQAAAAQAEQAAAPVEAPVVEAEVAQ